MSSLNGIAGSSVWNSFRNGAKILSTSIKKLKLKFDTVIFMVLYQNIIRLITEWPCR